MLNSAVRFKCLVLIVWAFGTAPVWANDLVVQVRTNCRPMEDFHTAVVTLKGKSYRVTVPASPSRNWSRGVRIAEIPTGEGTFLLNVALTHRTKGTVVERPVRATVGDWVRIVTVVLACPEPAPRTGHGSAPGDAPRAPQVRRPGSPIGSSPSPGSVRPVLPGQQSRVCENSVQGRIAWDYSGNRRWSQANVIRLCRGAENSTEPARCFQKVMHGNVSHGTNTRWRWQDALDLCGGARNHRTRIACFSEQIRQGAGQRAAIVKCRNR